MRRSDAGYSLVEMLAALVVLGSIFLLIVSGIGTTHRVWERSDARLGSVETVVEAQNVLRTRLEHAYPQSRFDASAPYVDFRGEADRLDFLSPASGNGGRQALRRYDVALTSAGELVLESVSDVAAQSAKSSDRAVLLRAVEGLSLLYYGSPASGGVNEWQPRWVSRSRLPGLILIRLQFPPGDSRIWPELIVHPSATVDTQCVLDTRTGKCRGRA